METKSSGSMGGAALPPHSDEKADAAAGEICDAVRWIRIAELQASYSPRLGGEDSQHLQAMADSDYDLPPIIVQRSTNRVIDGMHRIRAAELRGDQEIRVRYFSGDDASAFVLAVQSNVQHGLPLSLADRKEAAKRILDAYEHWSDRAIGSVAGLSHKTVATLRADYGRPGGAVRVGRDGHARPVNTACGRERARIILEKDPTASLRQVSSAAGVSPGTVRAVRDQLRNDRAGGDRPEVSADSSDVRSDRPTDIRPAANRSRSGHPRSVAEPVVVLRKLRADPSIRLTQSGRQLLSMIAVASMDAVAYDRLVSALPDHCVESVAELAASSVRAWKELESRLVERQETMSAVPRVRPTALNASAPNPTV